MTTSLISTEGLRRTFPSPRGGEIVAVEDLTLDITEGSLTALLGPNGAGKSTTMRMLTTLLPPSAGRAEICGWDIAAHPREVRARIGYVGQKHGISPYQRVRDELHCQGRFYGLSRSEARRRTEELIEVLQLGPVAEQTAQHLSGGQQRRADIALGLISRPRLLLLDEPSTGLDPQSRANLWEHIMQARLREEMTVLLTTHYLEEADRFAERVVVVDHGRLIADGTPDQLKSTLAGDLDAPTLDDVFLTLTGRSLRDSNHSTGEN